MNLTDLDVAARMRKLPPEFQEAWRREGLCALFLATSDGPVPRYAGDNALGRPLKIGVTVPFKDETSRRMLENCPYHDLRVRSRIWFLGRDKAERMARLAKQYVGQKAERIRRGWAHLDGNYDVGRLEDWIFEKAKDLKMSAWSDLAVLRMIDDVERHRMFSKALEDAL